MISAISFILILKGGLIDWCNYGKLNSFEIGLGLFLIGALIGLGMVN